jgi:hypothetical protein
MLADIWQNVSQIIKEAATSPLGLLALMIIALAILAFFFFKDAGVPVRIAIFITSFVAVVVFAAKIAYKAAQPKSDGSPTPTPISAATPAPTSTATPAPPSTATPAPTSTATPTSTPDTRRTWNILRGREPGRPHAVFSGKAGTRYTIWYDEGDGDSVGIDNGNSLDPKLRNLIPLAKGNSSEYTIENGDNLGIYLRKGATYAKGHIEERK